MIKLIVFISLFMVSSFICSASNHLGLWYTKGKHCIIQIKEQNNKYFGEIVWMKNPYDKNGNPKVDINNKDKSLRNQSVMGLVILKDLNLYGNALKGGEIYDPRNGKTYNAIIKHVNGRLHVKGYKSFSLFGRTEDWKRCNSMPDITDRVNTLNI